jgi:glutamine amidotransferase
MCRLFGFRSVINSQVHSSLVHADNALSSQSVRHPDGWGVAYYQEDTPHLIKSVDRAIDDQIFHKVSGVVSSHTVLAHIRKATHGSLNILNSHPFQYGNWVFAHNGNLKDFDTYRGKLLNYIDPMLKNFILGTTDSEILFFILLSLIKKRQPLSEKNIELVVLKEITEELCAIVCKYSGPLYGGDDNDPKENHITYLLTSGKVMVGFNGGQNLNYTTYKNSCSERDTCSHYSAICENEASNNEKINHLIFSSENLQGENIWKNIKKGELIGVNSEMTLSRFNLKIQFT